MWKINKSAMCCLSHYDLSPAPTPTLERATEHRNALLRKEHRTIRNRDQHSQPNLDIVLCRVTFLAFMIKLISNWNKFSLVYISVSMDITCLRINKNIHVWHQIVTWLSNSCLKGLTITNRNILFCLSVTEWLDICFSIQIFYSFFLSQHTHPLKNIPFLSSSL